MHRNPRLVFYFLHTSQLEEVRAFANNSSNYFYALLDAGSLISDISNGRGAEAAGGAAAAARGSYLLQRR